MKPETVCVVDICAVLVDLIVNRFLVFVFFLIIFFVMVLCIRPGWLCVCLFAHIVHFSVVFCIT